MQAYEIIIIIVCVIFVLLVFSFSIINKIKNKNAHCYECTKNKGRNILKEYKKKYHR